MGCRPYSADMSCGTTGNEEERALKAPLSPSDWLSCWIAAGVAGDKGIITWIAEFSCRVGATKRDVDHPHHDLRHQLAVEKAVNTVRGFKVRGY